MLGVQHRNLSIAIVLIYVRVAYVNLIATGIVFNIRASSSHIGQMVAFSEHRRWIISVFDRRSIMNRLYWHDQQVGYVCFIPFVWEQRGVIAAVADQTAMISHLLPMCWATRGRSWGHVMMWARFGSQGSIALNWHSRYSGTRYSGTWLYQFTELTRWCWVMVCDFIEFCQHCFGVMLPSGSSGLIQNLLIIYRGI